MSRSLINMRNRTGPRTLPWGTPNNTLSQSDSLPLTLTLCFLLVSHSLIYQPTLPSIPCAVTFFNSLSVGTLSKALAKSR